MKKILSLLLFLCVASAGAAFAEVRNETPLDAKVREVSKTLRCTVCQNESIWDSKAELAAQMREVVRERLAAGETPDEIRAYFKSRYGDYILLKPERSGMNWILWAGPFVLFAVGAVFLYRVLRKWVAETPTGGADSLPPLDPLQRKRIEEELKNL
jgi:cytochrome c-type biogenesis protein CcmH